MELKCSIFNGVTPPPFTTFNLVFSCSVSSKLDMELMHEIKVLSCSKTTFMRMGSGSSFFSLSTQNFSKREERENCDKEEPLEFTATNCQPAMARSTNSSAATCSSGIMGSFSCRIGLPLLLKRQTSRPTQSLDQNFYEKMSPHFYSSNEM